MELIDRTISTYLHRGMMKTLRKLQKLNSDPLAFGEVFRVHYPLEWEWIDWKAIYQAAEIELTVKYETKSYGVFR